MKPIKNSALLRAINMSAKSLSFNDPLPSDVVIYADASFILNVIAGITNRREKFQIDCEAFLKRLKGEIDSDNLYLVTSDFAIDEICYKIIENSLSKNVPFFDSSSGKTYKTPKELFKKKPEIIQLFIPKVDRFYLYLESIPFFVLSYPELKDLPEPLYLQVKRLIASYNLYPADAYHIAVAQSAGINYFVAVDSDWFRIDDINLYTCLPTP
ncbi:MAG: PIN domain-containing protein [Thermodesulfobacteriota bacterium]